MAETLLQIVSNVHNFGSHFSFKLQPPLHPHMKHEPLKTSHGIIVAVQIVKLHIELFKCTLYTLVEQYSGWLNS